MNVKAGIKNILAGASMVVPYGYDFYLKYIAARNQISYRGIFNSFEEAKSCVSSGRTSEYDVVNKNKKASIKEGTENLDTWLHYHDYPYLFWVCRLLNDDTSLVDLGGSLGHFYYSTRAIVTYPDYLRWQVAELPAAVELGRQIAQLRNEKKLSFIESDRLPEANPANLFISSGTIQYMEPELDEILQSLAQLPEHIILNNSPLHENRQYWTLQELKDCEVPYRIYSKENLYTMLAGLGYAIVDEWHYERLVEIPFNPDCKVVHYSGLCATRSSIVARQVAKQVAY